MLLLGTNAVAQTFYAHRTKMRVGIHEDVTLIPWVTHELAFTNASNALVTDNGSNDVACGPTLEGYSYWWFGGGGSDDDVSNQTEYQATQTNGANAYYNIVDTINWCQVTGAAGGCGWPQNGMLPFLVTRARATSTARGNVLAHEYGHTVGLGHDNLGNQIMDPNFLTTTDNKVKNTTLCNEFRPLFGWPSYVCPSETDAGTTPAICTTQSVALFSMSAPPMMSMSIDALEPEVYEESDFSGVSIEELVDGAILDRIPAEVEDYFGDQDVAVLRGVLSDPAKSESHRMAATFIGLISNGAEVDVQALVDYAADPAADVAAAMMALGYLVSRHGNENALVALADEFLDGPNSEDATLGLTLSGDVRAHDLLTDAASRTDDPVAKLTLREQAEENARIAQIGLRAHYLNPPAPVWLDVPDQGAGTGGPLPMDE